MTEQNEIEQTGTDAKPKKDRRSNQSYRFTTAERTAIEAEQDAMSERLKMDVSFKQAAQSVVRKGLEAAK